MSITGKAPEWRVTFWFLANGWTQIGYAFVAAKSEHLALMVCTQRASELGFRVDADTRVDISPEPGTL
jgi:hypothetical protein